MSGTSKLQRRWVVEKLLADRRDRLVIAGVGSTVWDCAAAGDHPLTFPLWNAMGAAAMVGLGVALAQPGREVLVITGDGEILMQVGALATIAAQKPKNLSIVVLDNECYFETGAQPTHTGMGVDLTTVASGFGITESHLVRSKEDVVRLCGSVGQKESILFAQIKIDASPLPRVMPPRDGSYLKDRFRSALLGPAAFD
jgi:thiamine pyrophosphate-dependent acetolactate synthase large subunit-like protein